MNSTDIAVFSNVRPVKRPQGSGPLLQWFNALPAGKQLATGWHLQYSRCSAALNEALHNLGTPRVTILHRSTGDLTEYWQLETASLFILCDGFADTWEMKSTTERTGIAYGWIEEKSKSKVKARVFVEELVAMGYYEPFTITLEGMITEEFLKALSEQFKVLDAYESLTKLPAPFWGFSLTLAPAAEPKWVGHGKQSPIVPMEAQLPDDIDEEYLTTHLCPQALVEKILAGNLVARTIKWSEDVSHTITQGQDKEPWETPEYEEALHQNNDGDSITGGQRQTIENLANLLGREVTLPSTGSEAKELIRRLNAEYNEVKRATGNTRGRARTSTSPFGAERKAS